ncbi:MAG TPA: L,D-transpeptidase family protein [Steroidobacteraceae bacterium]|jgi:murein L,D-transpeptidase YafK|nr:L,D-transpeptidase family protein [Steroidobacteraceae bacterium]
MLNRHVSWASRAFRVASLVCLLASTVARGAGFASGPEIATADHIVVRKAERKLYLYSGGRLLGTYKIALGLAPVGQKERENDFRTPEGHYYLARRNTRSNYFLAIQVSYPNQQDEMRARKRRWAPGGSIMIHGLPNTLKHPASWYASSDWTDGCIALSNSDMVEVWMRTQDNIPIDIYP